MVPKGSLKTLNPLSATLIPTSFNRTPQRAVERQELQAIVDEKLLPALWAHTVFRRRVGLGVLGL